MTLSSEDYALLAKHSYHEPDLKNQFTLGGVRYRALDYADNPKTGFQATAYERVDTREVVIAYRGTEADREPGHDGLTDAGMALSGVNAQTADSLAFTRKVIGEAKLRAEHGKFPLNVTVTGHSLGGTLAEINAYEFGLHGQTYNAYGAAGLMQGIPQGGQQVINHVRATDVVSAGSPHFGEVRTYASQQDLDALANAGYSNSHLFNALPAHAPIMGKIQLAAHGISNFAPDPTTHITMLNPEDAQRAQANAVMIDSYRSDIRHARMVVAVPGELATLQSDAYVSMGKYAGEKIVQGAHVAEHGAHYVSHKAVQGVAYASDKAVQGAHAVEHGAQYVGHKAVQGAAYASDKAAQGAHVVEHGAQYVGHKAVQGAAHVSDQAVQGVHIAEHGAQYVGHKAVQSAVYVSDQAVQGAHAVKQGAQSIVHSASQEYTELATRLDGMLQAAKVGDWASFNKDNKVFAEMAPGRAQHANATANVDRQEQHASQLNAAEQQTQAQQRQHSTHGPVMHR